MKTKPMAMLLMMLAGWINREQQHMIEYLRVVWVDNAGFGSSEGFVHYKNISKQIDQLSSRPKASIGCAFSFKKI